jgi:hypothetical protein
MHRMGHGSMRAALIYQHATTDRDRRIADAMNALVDALAEDTESSNDGPDDEDDDGAAGALVPVA